MCRPGMRHFWTNDKKPYLCKRLTGTEVEDSTLIARVKAGDRGAFNELYGIYWASLVNYAGLFVGDDGAEDVVQDVFVRVWLHRDNLRDDGTLQGYLLRSVYHASLNATHILNTYFVNMQYGSYSLTRQFVNTYLNRDGSRFTDKAGYEKTLFADEFENRDYRLMQSIRYPGYTRRNNNVNMPYAPDFGYCVTGYQPIKWVIDDTSMDSNTAPCATSIPILRYAEVLLNYAEAKAELGEFSETVWNATIKLLRERAGVDGTMPSAYDPYMAEYFLNTTTDMAILEIRRERGIELLLENCRWDDDMRWGMGRLLERPWYGVYVGELGKVYDMDGDGSGDVCFVRENPPVTEPGVTYRVLGGDYALTDGDSGYIECYIRMNRKWDDKKYVRPIPTTALNDNPALGQNPGWKK